MNAEPRREHRWLDRLVGEWSIETEGIMGPDQPPVKSRGDEVVRSVGGLWTVAEGQGEMPGSGNTMKSIMTLGFDPRSGRFVGTFIASMMTHLWVYSGSLDAAERVLTLDVEGPDFTGQKTAKYRDCIEFDDDDHRIMTSRVLGDDGNWLEFMTAHYHRRT